MKEKMACCPVLACHLPYTFEISGSTMHSPADHQTTQHLASARESYIEFHACKLRNEVCTVSTDELEHTRCCISSMNIIAEYKIILYKKRKRVRN